jgi:DNA-binding transcriptional MocR family regulator
MDRISFLNQLAAKKHPYNLGAGVPPLELYPPLPLSEWLCEAEKSAGPELTGYHQTAGFIREEAALTFERNEGMSVHPSSILVTNGVQEAIALAVSVFKQAQLVCLDPTYPGFEDCVAAFGLGLRKLHPSNWEEEIIGLPAGSLLYLSSDFANPSGMVISESQRRHIADCATRNGFYVFDDATYRSFHLGNPPLALKCLAPQNVIHALSFSKIVAPGLRTAFVYLPDALVEAFTFAKSNISLNNSGITQSLVVQWLRHNGYSLTAHLTPLKDRLRQNQQVLQQHGIAYSGGFFCTYSLHEEAGYDLCGHLLETAGIAVCPMMLFSSHESMRNQLRLCVANIQSDELHWVLNFLANFSYRHATIS